MTLGAKPSNKDKQEDIEIKKNKKVEKFLGEGLKQLTRIEKNKHFLFHFGLEITLIPSEVISNAEYLIGTALFRIFSI